MAGREDSIAVRNVLEGTLSADNAMATSVGTAFDPAYALVDEAGAQIVLYINSSDYKMYAQLKDKSGNLIYTSNIIDLPLETMIVNGRYDSATKKLILTLDNGNEIEIPLGDLISGLQSEITPTNMLSSDLVDDTNKTHKFITAAERTSWNAKEDAANKVTSINENSTDLQYPSAKYLYNDTKGGYTITNEAEEMDLDNTADAPMKLDLKGNTSQDSTTGKNLFDGVLELGNFNSNTGEKVPNSNYIINTNPIPVEELTNYKISSNGTGIGVYIFEYKEDLTYNLSSRKAINADSYLTTNSGTKYINFRTIDENTNLQEKIQIEKGSSATSWEPYTGGSPAPNPTYPFDIHNVSGDNTIEICGKNLFNVNKVILNRQINNGVIEYNANNDMFYTKINIGSTYTFSRSTTEAGFIFTTDDIPKTGATTYDRSNISGLQSISITPTHQYLCLQIKKSEDKSTFMIELGNQSSEYEAYTGNSQLISLGVENLFDKDNVDILNGWLNSTTMRIATGQTDRLLYIPCKPNTTYTISRSIITSSFRVATYDSTPMPTMTGTNTDYSISNYIAYNSGTSITITTNANAKFLIVHYGNINSDTNINESLATIQIEKGSKANSYSPYGTTPIWLGKIGDYQDYIYKNNDKWYLHKEIGKYVYNNDLATNYITENEVQMLTPVLDVDSSVASLSNKAFCNIMGNEKTNYTGLNGTTSSSKIKLSMALSYASSYSEFREIASDNNLTIYYVLDTPTDTEITDTTLISQLNALANAKSYDPITHITQNANDKPFIIKASAFKNTTKGNIEAVKENCKQIENSYATIVYVNNLIGDIDVALDTINGEEV